ncbi:MAG: pyridoxal-phosphate dependent enzyme [Acinetobacter sp.]
MFDSLARAIPYQTLLLHGMKITVKRLDLVHPQISGNKFFKLKYNFLDARRQGFKKVLTFGGAYSNHIAAAAYAAHACGFASAGMIRGEELAARPLNATLQAAQQFGMQLRFISREQYRKKHTAEFLAQLRADYPEHYVIPEGGTNALAVQGCREILTENDLNNFDLICCAAGTGGTIAGLIEASLPRQRILGFSALKGLFLNDEVAKLTAKTNWEIIDDYCGGGYAKTTPELLQFIRLFEAKHSLPLEQIYTGKMLFGISQMIQRGEIASDQRVLIIHSGGLQGKLQK